MKTKELETTLSQMLSSPVPDAEVRTRLEKLAQDERAFPGFTWLWGPTLYRRNRVLFRPFILSHFATWQVDDRRKFRSVEWKGAVAATLDPWLAEVDRLDDLQLFRNLYVWKQESVVRGWNSGTKRLQAILSEILTRLRAAPSPAARQTVLQKFDLWFQFDESAALEIYQLAASASGSFILRHLPSSFLGDEKRVLWTRLIEAAAARGDDELRWALYRRQVPLKQWQSEILVLCRTVSDAAQLNAELERRHPEGWSLNVGDGFLQLLKNRGREVFPYLTKHLAAVRKSWFSFGKDAFQKLRDLAREREWWDLWAALIRISGDAKEFNSAVAGLVADSRLPEPEILSRLRLLGGVSREWNWGGFGLAVQHQLTDETALALYRRFPDLARGSYRQHLQPHAWGASYDRFVAAILTAGDELMIDFLASRYVTRVPNPWNKKISLVAEAERFSHYYEGLRSDETVFTRRAAMVLGQIPSYTIFNYDKLLRENRLARLLFERSAKSFLGDPRSMADLVEAPEIHVQALAYRTLGLDDDRARALAAANLPVLIGTLLRPLQRATRALAFGALSNAANTPENARFVLARARDALSLPDVRYPKEALFGLIARLLHRWPELRGPGETPTVYERAA